MKSDTFQGNPISKRIFRGENYCREIIAELIEQHLRETLRLNQQENKKHQQ
ncbi:MAG: hypothetical protein V1269_15950 [Deltaproteobacteria bacterium]|nr:hypothetical protein [SAR324 cluster bacterium]MEE1577685.1 hypothetical protein [Deltaproteobacteria bacterium]